MSLSRSLLVLAAMFVAALAAILLPTEPAPAGPILLSDQLAQVSAVANTAAARLLSGDRAAAVDSITMAADLADGLDPSGIADVAARKHFQKRLTTLEKKLAVALRKTNDTRVNSLSAQRAVGAAADAGLDAERVLQHADGGVVLEELGARSAGFHDAGKQILFRVTVPPGSTDEPQITVFDESGGAVETTFEEIRRDASGNRVIRVTMGASGGAGRVEVTLDGVTRRWLLFNYGPKEDYPGVAKPEASRFDGSWTGEFKGTATDHGFVVNTFGPVEFTVVNGRIQITEPGDGSGAITGTGRSRFSGGSGGIASGTYTFQGLFVEFFVGPSSASGNWNVKYAGGSGHGRWSARRNGP